jgi:hypothetical protein
MAMGEPAAYRVNAQVAPGGTNSAPLDWNNDLITPDAILGAGIDLNHNGIIGDAPFSGYDDWANVDLQQINGRSSGFGFSEGGGLNRVGGGLNRVGGGVDGDGGGLNRVGGGLNRVGGGLNRVGGGIEEDTETANSTADAPSGLTCTQPLTTPGGTVIPGCTNSSGSLVEKAKSVPLTWTSPDFGQIRSYTVWRAIGSFTTSQQILANIGKFSAIGTVNGTPPSPSFIDNVNLKSSTTYTYFVTDSNKFTAKSGPSTTLVVTVKF